MINLVASECGMKCKTKSRGKVEIFKLEENFNFQQMLHELLLLHSQMLTFNVTIPCQLCLLSFCNYHVKE